MNRQRDLTGASVSDDSHQTGGEGRKVCGREEWCEGREGRYGGGQEGVEEESEV